MDRVRGTGTGRDRGTSRGTGRDRDHQGFHGELSS